jgi:hypothetical protein
MPVVSFGNGGWTFATNLARLGVAPHIIERLINHVTGTISGVAAIYNRANYMKEMRDAVTKYEDWFQKLCAHECALCGLN